MDTNNTNQPVNPSETPAQSQPIQNPTSNQRSILPIILGVLVLLIAVGGAYYLGSQKNSSTNQAVNTNRNTQTQPSPTETTTYSSPTPTNVAWKTESVQIKRESFVRGNEIINLAIQLPSDWTLKIVSKASSPNNIIKNCADYVLTSADSTAKLTISPLCAGGDAEYSNWPQDTVIVGKQMNAADSPSDNYRIRFFDSRINQYKYADTLVDTGKTPDANTQIRDAVTITHDPYQAHTFVTAFITLSYNGNVSEKEQSLKVVDQIAASIKLL